MFSLIQIGFAEIPSNYYDPEDLYNNAELFQLTETEQKNLKRLIDQKNNQPKQNNMIDNKQINFNQDRYFYDYDETPPSNKNDDTKKTSFQAMSQDKQTLFADENIKLYDF